MNTTGYTRNASCCLSDQERLTETLLRNLPGMVYRCANDRRRAMTFVSEGCFALTGHTQEQILEEKLEWGGMIHPEDLSAATQALDSALASSRSFDIRYRIVDKSGNEKRVRDRGSGVPVDDGYTMMIEGYIDDISPLRNNALDFATSGARFEKGLRREHERLAHADRLNTLGEMATGIAHEINQPLTAISLFAQTGKRLFEAGEYGKLKEIFDKLSQHSLRAGAIIERMQDMARRKEGAKQVIGLNTLIEGVVDLAEVDARTSDIVIELNAGDDLPEVRVDVVQIQQVILNLLRNGIDAMRSVDCCGGNTILLATRLRGNGFIDVSVIDTGCGLTDEVAEQLFESFSTSKSTGLGMGLPISKAIVMEHGGQLSFRNNETCGATFSFTLPGVLSGDASE